MSTLPKPRVSGPPPWLLIVASLFVAGHLGAVVLGALAAPSGPWLTSEGSSTATPPQFAFTLYNTYASDYLRLVKMTNNYHFLTNRPGLPGVACEVRLFDDNKRELAVLHFPDPKANRWVRHRQALLARWLADDQPVDPPQGEVIAAPLQQVPMVTIWEISEPQHLRRRTLPQHLIPRDRPVYRPSELSLLLAGSMVRYGCRERGAVSGELIRRTQEALPPLVLFRTDVQGFEPLIAHFGESRP